VRIHLSAVCRFKRIQKRTNNVTKLMFQKTRDLFLFTYNLFLFPITDHYKKQKQFTLREHLGSPPDLWGSSFSSFYLSCLCLLVFFLFLVSNVDSFSGLSIPDSPVFSSVYLYKTICIVIFYTLVGIKRLVYLRLPCCQYCEPKLSLMSPPQCHHVYLNYFCYL